MRFCDDRVAQIFSRLEAAEAKDLTLDVGITVPEYGPSCGLVTFSYHATQLTSGRSHPTLFRKA